MRHDREKCDEDKRGTVNVYIQACQDHQPLLLTRCDVCLLRRNFITSIIFSIQVHISEKRH